MAPTRVSTMKGTPSLIRFASSCFLVGSVVGGPPYEQAQKQDRGPYTVELTRQQIPLHTSDGVVQFKSAYHGQISIGSPNPQNMAVVFDTGSGHLVLPSTLCKSETCKAHTRYKRSASRSAVDIDSDGSKVAVGQPRDQITVSYGTGEITGVFMQEKVCFGQRAGPRADQLKAPPAASLIQTKTGLVHRANVTEQEDYSDDVSSRGDPNHGCMDVSIVAATEMTEDPFATFKFDGVLGLGLIGLSQTPLFNIFNVASQSAFDAIPGYEKVFSVYLSPAASEPSYITFGGYKKDKVAEGTEFAWQQIQDDDLGYWQINVKSITANGKRLDYCDDGTCRAVVDTGTSLLAVPSSLGPTLIDHLRFSVDAGSPCAGPGPEIEFELEGITVKLGPDDFARPEFVGQNDTDAKEPISCVAMLMHLDLPEPLSAKTLILGEPVLQRYYTAFDITPAAPRVGFVRAAHRDERDLLEVAV